MAILKLGSHPYFFKDGTPELTFKIQEDYFENNISDEENNFVLADGFYSRSIQQDELVLAFHATDDGQINRQLKIRTFFPKIKFIFSYHTQFYSSNIIWWIFVE